MGLDLKLLCVFIILNAINVIVQTAKSICTINCGRLPAAIINAFAYGFYTVVVVYMICDLPMAVKVIVVGTCNFLGVYIVKWVQEKLRKDRIWKVEATIPLDDLDNLSAELNEFHIPYIPLIVSDDKRIVLNIFCSTQSKSKYVKGVLKHYDTKYFVSEGKEL